MPDVFGDASDSIAMSQAWDAYIPRPASDNLFLSHSLITYCGTVIPHYGTVEEADKYFASKLRSNLWINATLEKKQQALVMATRAIERLNFVGEKADPDQGLEFPRDDSVIVPAAIRLACYEEAYQLLDGRDAESEYANQNVRMRKFDKVQTEWDRSMPSENILAGIVSITAWMYLYPYLRDLATIKLSRV